MVVIWSLARIWSDLGLILVPGQITRGFLFSSQNFYFFMSNSVNLFELIGVAIIS